MRWTSHRFHDSNETPTLRRTYFSHHHRFVAEFCEVLGSLQLLLIHRITDPSTILDGGQWMRAAEEPENHFSQGSGSKITRGRIDETAQKKWYKECKATKPAVLQHDATIAGMRFALLHVYEYSFPPYDLGCVNIPSHRHLSPTEECLCNTQISTSPVLVIPSQNTAHL